MKIAIFGSTGFVGKYLLKALYKNHHEVNALVRHGSEKQIVNTSNVTIINGEIINNTALDQTIMNCSAVIYNIGIIREFPSKGITYQKLHYEYAKHVIDKAKHYKIKHFTRGKPYNLCNL